MGLLWVLSSIFVVGKVILTQVIYVVLMSSSEGCVVDGKRILVHGYMIGGSG